MSVFDKPFDSPTTALGPTASLPTGGGGGGGGAAMGIRSEGRVETMREGEGVGTERDSE